MNPATRVPATGVASRAMENANALVENQPAGQAAAPGAGGARDARSKAPVFVLGCGRSGTKFLYHTLLSAGGFAVYYAESNAFNLLGLRFGNLASRRNRRQLLDAYFTSKLFHRTGLDPKEIEERVMEDCRNAGDFLRIVMEAIARKQGVDRWAECTPLHLLYLPLIKQVIPDALVVHIIRDGRDVTASLYRIGWIRPLPWDRARAFVVPAIYWRWVVSKGRRYGRALGADYMEVHYEDLVQNPRATLARIGKFIEHDLDYDRIQRVRWDRCTIQILRFAVTARRLKRTPSAAGNACSLRRRFATWSAASAMCSSIPGTHSKPRQRSGVRRGLCVS
ncbi:MAG TPA: sulfotransferase [Terriglobales bacterium]|nr:sulfotransferase [Terriglobales bacterium]